MIDNHVCGVQSQATSQGPKISSEIASDGSNKYPEIIDYHPDKKVGFVADNLP